MKSFAELMSALSLTAAVLGGIGYVYENFGFLWALGSFFFIWLLGPFIPLYAGFHDGQWVLAAWVYLPAAIAVLATYLAPRR